MSVLRSFGSRIHLRARRGVEARSQDTSLMLAPPTVSERAHFKRAHCIHSEYSPDIPVIDLSWLRSPVTPEAQQACAALAETLERNGCAFVQHPLLDMEANEDLLDMMESYFCQEESIKAMDIRPGLQYLAGATPGGKELPRFLVDANMQRAAASLPAEHRPTVCDGPDPKWRFFWRVGERPIDRNSNELNNANLVIPAGFPNWSAVMDSWGSRVVDVALVVAQAAAAGLGLPPDSISSLMHQAPHYVAPTGSDLSGDLAQVGRVFAGFHYDLNLLTLHGRSRFPGLFVWVRDGRRVPVRVPPGCLLVQAGKQLEYLTGGSIVAGMHEVVVSADTLAAVEQARAAHRPLWRVSSTVFVHVASKQVLQPLGHFATPVSLAAYPPIIAGDQVQQELEAVRLKKPSTFVSAFSVASVSVSAEDTEVPATGEQVTLDSSSASKGGRADCHSASGAAESPSCVVVVSR